MAARSREVGLAISFSKEFSLNAKKTALILAAVAFPSLFFLVAESAWAQDAGAAAPHNVLQLSASGSLEVQQDMLSMTLIATGLLGVFGVARRRRKTA